MFSVILEIPFPLDNKTINWACRSVGKFGYSLVTTFFKFFISFGPLIDILFSSVLILAPTFLSKLNSVDISFGSNPLIINFPAVTAAVTQNVPHSILSPSWPVDSSEPQKVPQKAQSETPLEKRARLMTLAKHRAIRVLNDGKPNNQRRARQEMMTNCIQWNLVSRGDFAYDLLIGGVNKDSEIDEEWINGFN